MNIKSSTVAGVLGIFLGTFGAHDFYLGGSHKKKGIIHACLAGSGSVVSILSSLILPNILSFSALLTIGGLLSVLGIISAGCFAASGIWGLIDGIKILVAGDAGLAAEGFAVAPPPAMYQQPQYGYGQQPPYYGAGQPQYTQPQSPQSPYNNPVGQSYSPQPSYQQPMNQSMGQQMGESMNQPTKQPANQSAEQPSESMKEQDGTNQSA